MKVKELIELLKQADLDKEAYFRSKKMEMHLGRLIKYCKIKMETS